MEISRLDSGREDLQVVPVDLGALATGLLRSRGLPADAELDGQRVVVQTDPRRVERVLANLIDNASTHGGPDVEVRVTKNRTSALVDVRDRGPGIAAEHLPHVFERFYKVDPARAGSGSGLGLAIAHENARLLGGELVVWSQVGAGSRFTLTLPVAEALRDRRDGDTRERDDQLR